MTFATHCCLVKNTAAGVLIGSGVTQFAVLLVVGFAYLVLALRYRK